jgi:hypothetical protein
VEGNAGTPDPTLKSFLALIDYAAIEKASR